jgi:hypothetical protein
MAVTIGNTTEPKSGKAKKSEPKKDVKKTAKEK